MGCIIAVKFHQRGGAASRDVKPRRTSHWRRDRTYDSSGRRRRRWTSQLQR